MVSPHKTNRIQLCPIRKAKKKEFLAVGHVWFQDFIRTCLRQACMSVRFQDLSVSKVVSKAVSTIKALAL
uniref:Uncharacterized protein n=1 Tax=Picea sitchensis TaxID=3332 RepID=D5ACP5_PICSI|nr:unknown [Picea sitchensis]